MRWFPLIALLLFPTISNAQTLFSDFSLSYLKGSNYQVGDPERQLLTLEYVNASTWGDLFLFTDRSHSKNGNKTNYSEISPRLKIWQSETHSLINQISLSTTAELGEDFANYLYGVGIDLNIPKFKFFKLNLLKRNNEQIEDNWQLTYVWAIPFQFSGHQFIYDGFIDWSSKNSQTYASVNFTSQLKYSISSLFNTENKVYLGTEIVYWRNKYGIADLTEKNLNLLIKYHF